MIVPSQVVHQMKQELHALNEIWPNSEECYYLELDPPHVLFNTNCSPDLEYRVRQILDKYKSDYEGHSH
jgi:hypothetical protein